MLSAEEFYAIVDGCPTKDDGEMDEKVLIDLIADKMESDPEERRKRAVAQIKRFRRDGQTPADGSIMLDGMESFCYEPRRLVKDDTDETLIELKDALPRYTRAEARRKRKNANAASRKADLAQALNDAFNEWCLTQPKDRQRIHFYIDESGVWSPDEVEQDEDDEDVA